MAITAIEREATRMLIDFLHRGLSSGSFEHDRTAATSDRPKQILLEPQLVNRASSSPSTTRHTA
jgi:hypothetical protein